MKRNIILLLALMIVGSIVFICCKDSIEDQIPKPKPEPEPTPVLSIPKIDTLKITDITTTSIIYEVTIVNDGGASITERGVCYALDDNPTIIDDKTSDGKGTGTFSGKISELPYDMDYYVRAYATNSEGTSYGESVKVALIRQDVLIGVEEAYPDIEGELVTVSGDDGSKITCRKIDGLLFYQGDIIIPSPSETRGVGRNTKASTHFFGDLWPDNTFIYEIDEAFPDAVRIKEAIDYFKKTNIVFKKRENEEYYAYFVSDLDKNASYVGMIGNVYKHLKKQGIYIQPNSGPGTIAHEICHALGLAHEHSKPSALDYIIINENNIEEKKKDNFEIVSDSLFYETPGFDFESIMLYSSNAFGKKEEFWITPFYKTYKYKTTITKKDGTTFKGQRKRLSEDDIKILNYLYPINSYPSVPKLISPKDNATISELRSCVWEASTDPENDPLVYDLYLTPRTNYGIPPQYFNQVNWEWRFENILSTKYEFNQSFLPYGTYYWAVVAREDKPDKAKASHSSIYTFTLAPFNAPMLTYPADRSIFNKNKTAEINIHWESVTGADEYWLNIFPDGKSFSPTFNESAGRVTNKKININREENGIYIIQVKARKTGGEWSKFSDSHKIIIDTPPAKPVITAPENNISITRNTSQTFSWSKPSLGIDRYYLHIVKGTNLNATPIYEPNEFKENSKSINCNWKPGTYTWSVRAMKETPEGFSDTDYETTISWGNYAQSRTFVITELVSVPTVYTSPATNVTPTSATLNGEVTSDGGTPITQRGFYYSKTNNTPDVSDGIEIVNGSIGVYNKTISNLQANTTFYFRAFATNSQGATTGDVQYFKTTVKELILTTNAISLNINKSGTVNISSGSGSYTVKSNNENIATASVEGNTITITGKSGGEATITVTDTETQQTQNITVTVNEDPDVPEGVIIENGVLVKWPCDKIPANGHVVIPNSVMSIGEYAFASCSSLTSITIPNSVTSIGLAAFNGCKNLTSITIPNSVTSIGWFAFSFCENLISIIIPNSVTSIGNYAFRACYNLTFVDIPNSVTSIGYGAFFTGQNLASINVDINNKVYSSKNGILFNKEKTTLIQYPSSKTEESYQIPISVNRIEKLAFSDCMNLISITIPNSVKYIGESAFSSCTSLISITIPNSVEFLGGDFSYCWNLTSITFPSSVYILGDFDFYLCENLTSIIIPNSVTKIPERAFEGCRKLTSITIPNSVRSIGWLAFRNCYNLRSMTCKATTPPENKGFSYNKKLIVPKECKEAYQQAEYWKDCNPIVEEGEE